MRHYERTVQAAVLSNNVALTTIFGAPSQPGLFTRAAEWVGFESGEDVYDGLGSLWRHCAKDWSAAGAAGGEALRRRIISRVADECRSRSNVSILVPGCGQARLAWALAMELPNAHITGLERSEATLGFARHLLEESSHPETLKFHPFLDAFPNNWDASSRCAAVAVPDVVPSMLPNLSLRQADFLEPDPAWSARKHDIVITHFFLDCVEDLVAGCSAVHDMLAPGGIWIFAGPLHFHQSGDYMPRPSPSVSHLLELARDLGFGLEAEPERVPSPYLRRPKALVHEADWTAVYFVARRVK